MSRNGKSGKFITKKMRQKRKRITLTFILGLILIAALQYVVVCASLNDENIWGQVSVNGTPVGGMSREEAVAAVTAQYEEKYADLVLSVVLSGTVYSINVGDALSLDVEAAVDKAYQTGHGLWILRGAESLSLSLGNSRSYVIYPTVTDEAALDTAIAESGILEYNSTTEPTWEIQGDSLVIHKGKAGAAIDEEGLKESILNALNNHDYESTITCPATVTEPKEADLSVIREEACAEATDATLAPDKDYEIVPSVTGVTFDLDEAQQIYDSTEYGGDAVIPLTVTEPAITTEDLEANLFKDTLATYSTYGGGSSARVSNIYKAVESCSGTILLPGETFSYNDALGERTIERGYQVAAAYSSNEVIQEVGGGICQVSSTIFAAALYTNLTINERSNHSLPVSYLPLGMDATVSWGGPDFRFTNSYSYPVKLVVTFDGYTLTAAFYGTDVEGHVDVYLETLSESSVNTYRKYYDENWNLLSTDLITSSNYTVETEEETEEETENTTEKTSESTDGNTAESTQAPETTVETTAQPVTESSSPETTEIYVYTEETTGSETGADFNEDDIIYYE